MMKRSLPNKKRWPSFIKLTLIITLIVIITAMCVTYLSIIREQKTFKKELQQQAGLLIDTLEAVLSDPLYHLDVNFMSDMMEVLGEDRKILISGRVYDADGRIIADAYSERITYKMDIDPVGRQLIESGTRVYEWHADQLIVGQPVIVGHQCLGAISVGLPTAPLKTKISAMRNQGISIAAGAIIIGILTALLFSRSITEPLKEMVRITKRVATGDLNQNIPIRDHDELNVLAGSFNNMITKLKNAHNMLEQQVQERTADLVEANRQLKHEIADHKGTMKKLRESKAEAEAANIAKSEFLANMSHELRTPLNHIIGFTELLLERYFGELTEKQEKNMGHVLQSSRHLLSLINDILDLSKVEAGRLELDVSDVNLKPLLENSIIMVKEKAMKHNIGLTALLEGLPEKVGADKKMLKQIIYNILSNAVKFTPDSGKVVLRARLYDISGENEKKPALEISVSDTGIGVEQEDIERIFNPFEQADSSKSKRYQGTGLGLSLTKRLVELHGGSIRAESEGEGKGSTFRVIIPLTGKG